jgi:hypothetical protein
MREAVEWAQTYTLRELDDALNKYIGRIKDALLYGLRGGVNPTASPAACTTRPRTRRSTGG